MRDKYPENWLSMTWEQQDQWALEQHLKDDFPGRTFRVQIKPTFVVNIDQADVDVKEIQASVDDWFLCAYGTRVVWGMLPIRTMGVERHV